MKLLMFYTKEFWYKTFEKMIPDVPDADIEDSLENAIVVLFQTEAEDVERRSKVETKFVKNVKWLAGKFSTKNIVLHFFSHLSMSKSPPEFSNEMAEAVTERLKNTGYNVIVTPYGYLNEWKLHVMGESLAKVFKEF